LFTSVKKVTVHYQVNRIDYFKYQIESILREESKIKKVKHHEIVQDIALFNSFFDTGTSAIPEYQDVNNDSIEPERGVDSDQSDQSRHHCWWSEHQLFLCFYKQGSHMDAETDDFHTRCMG